MDPHAIGRLDPIRILNVDPDPGGLKRAKKKEKTLL
jgi:hypothetical protein